MEKLEQRTIERAAAEENGKPVVPGSEGLEFQGSESTITKNGRLDDGGKRSKNRPTENAAAGSIAELYDQLGGFIKR